MVLFNLNFCCSFLLDLCIRERNLYTIRKKNWKQTAPLSAGGTKDEKNVYIQKGGKNKAKKHLLKRMQWLIVV